MFLWTTSLWFLGKALILKQSVVNQTRRKSTNSGIVGKSTSREKKQIEEAKLHLKIKEEELDTQVALKISDGRTQFIEEIERTELIEKQLTEAFQLDLDQQPPMFVLLTKTTVSQPPVPVLHSDLNSHTPLFTSQTMSRSTAQQNWSCSYFYHFKKCAHRCDFVYVI